MSMGILHCYTVLLMWTREGDRCTLRVSLSATWKNLVGKLTPLLFEEATCPCSLFGYAASQLKSTEERVRNSGTCYYSEWSLLVPFNYSWSKRDRLQFLYLCSSETTSLRSARRKAWNNFCQAFTIGRILTCNCTIVAVIRVLICAIPGLDKNSIQLYAWHFYAIFCFMIFMFSVTPESWPPIRRNPPHWRNQSSLPQDRADVAIARARDVILATRDLALLITPPQQPLHVSLWLFSNLPHGSLTFIKIDKLTFKKKFFRASSISLEKRWWSMHGNRARIFSLKLKVFKWMWISQDVGDE